MKLIFLGPPGAGKGTLAKILVEKRGLVHISTGDIFRAVVKSSTPLGLKVKEIMAKGALVPDELTISLVQERFGQGDLGAGFILDGFPRTIPQAEALKSISSLDRVIDFELGDSEILDRLTGRRSCRSCGTMYHLRNLPPKKEGFCDKDGAELYTRDDDKEETIKNRLRVYREQTIPLIAYYRERNLLSTIQADAEPIKVYGRLEEVLKTI